MYLYVALCKGWALETKQSAPLTIEHFAFLLRCRKQSLNEVYVTRFEIYHLTFMRRMNNLQKKESLREFVNKLVTVSLRLFFNEPVLQKHEKLYMDNFIINRPKYVGP